MALIRCTKGHYYDSSKHMTCPYCGVDLTGAAFSGISLRAQLPADEEKTLAAPGELDYEVTRARDDFFESDRTIGIFSSVSHESQRITLAGWLVCIKGKERGRDFRIRVGNNRVGRAPEMDICLLDESVSRIDHARIVYDPLGGSFYVTAAKSVEVACNGKRVFDAVPLKDGDTLSLGKSEYVFIAFCREGRTWENEE